VAREAGRAMARESAKSSLGILTLCCELKEVLSKAA